MLLLLILSFLSILALFFFERSFWGILGNIIVHTTYFIFNILWWQTFVHLYENIESSEMFEGEFLPVTKEIQYLQYLTYGLIVLDGLSAIFVDVESENVNLLLLRYAFLLVEMVSLVLTGIIAHKVTYSFKLVSINEKN